MENPQANFTNTIVDFILELIALQQDDGFNTNAHPLHIAARRGQLNEAQTLIQNGQDVNLSIGLICDRTPLHLAAQSGQHQLVELLIENGANTDKIDRFGWSPLHIASLFGHFETAKSLVERGAHCNILDNYYWSPLHCATFNGEIDICRLLLRFGADPEQVDSLNRNPIDVARRWGYTNIVTLVNQYRQLHARLLDNLNQLPPQISVGTTLIDSLCKDAWRPENPRVSPLFSNIYSILRQRYRQARAFFEEDSSHYLTSFSICKNPNSFLPLLPEELKVRILSKALTPSASLLFSNLKKKEFCHNSENVKNSR